MLLIWYRKVQRLWYLSHFYGICINSMRRLNTIGYIQYKKRKFYILLLSTELHLSHKLNRLLVFINEQSVQVCDATKA